MPRLLVHIATGPENATRAALGFLVASSALAAGHDVDVFLAGDAKTRGLSADALAGRPVEFATPDRLVALAFEADRVISY
jgi:predicted peroxiredoxin